ncbi:hypothetical protein SAMN04488602_104307 [Paenibacillus sp. cl123]|nr:hypothetical protein SAMN04488602_104307 [Paenibacillus sp. cl123]
MSFGHLKMMEGYPFFYLTDIGCGYAHVQLIH